MTNQAGQIGFSQRVRLDWLEQTANLVLAGNEKKVIEESLQTLLMDKVSVGGKAERGNREKIISILLKVWVNLPDHLKALHADGLELLRHLPRVDHIAVHWGMVMAVYPFWSEVAGQVGRLMKIQSTASASQIQRRIREQYGERETVARATRRIIRSFMDWGVIETRNTKGIYYQGKKAEISDMHMTTWLIEALLNARPSKRGIINELIVNTSLFPFVLHNHVFNGGIKTNMRLEIIRHGLDDTLVVLKK